jgi:predicted phosphodiesterase
MQLLHFSDLHGNRRAIEALTRVAARWTDAYVAITGDVCRDNFVARSEYDTLPNPRVWLVPGNHDSPAPRRLGHLNRVQWQAPFVAQLENCIIVGLDSESPDDADKQLQSLETSSEGQENNLLIVLHHKPFDRELKETILGWANESFRDLGSILLLHGHEHHMKSFFAEVSEDRLGNLAALTSRVYSANRTVGDGILGCANLLSIGNDGSIKVQTVYDPSQMFIEDGFLKRSSWGGLQPGWWWGEKGLPTRKLERGEDPLVVVDEYWRGLVRDRS